MALLLDTQILVWLATGDRRMSRKALAAIAAPNEELLVSAVIAWEFIDLERRGRFHGVVTLEEVIKRFQLAIIDFPADAWKVIESLADLHRDPVDRMLIAHAILQDMTLITADKTMRRYPVRTIW